MQIRKSHPTNRYIWIGVLVSAALTAIIGITATNLSGFEIVGKTVPFAYPWRLVGYYGLSGRLADINEVFRIPFIDFALIFLFYGIYLLISGVTNHFQRLRTEPSATD